MDVNHGESLEELDGKAWGDPPADATILMEEIYRLRRVKLKDLSTEDVARLLRQREGAEWVVPLAMDQLDDDPLAGDGYPGQLLASVLHNRDYFERFPNELLRLHSIRRDLIQLREDVEKVLTNPDWPRDI